MTIRLRELFTKVKKVMEVSNQMMLARAGVDLHSLKGEKDFATEVDFAIEEKVRIMLSEVTPEIPVLGEELGGAELTAPLFWTLDPIDGTINYSRNIPLCGISLALIKDGKAVIALVDLPYLSQSFYAIEGEGAFLNDEKISVSDTDSLDKCIVSFGDFAVGKNAKAKNDVRYKVIQNLSKKVMRVRMLGSAATDLSWLASGTLDASITLSNNVWDVQAGCLIVKEAGGVVCDIDGSPHSVMSRYTVATTPLLKGAVLDLLAHSIEE